MAPVQRDVGSRRKLRNFKNHFEAIRREPVEARITDEVPAVLPDILASESATMFRFLVPFEGIDAREVYIFATPYSIVLELTTKCMVRHAGPIETETQSFRVTRELRFRNAIAKGSTVARFFGASLEITSLRTLSTSDEAWSEFIQVDTRNSLGFCEAPACATSVTHSGVI